MFRTEMQKKTFSTIYSGLQFSFVDMECLQGKYSVLYAKVFYTAMFIFNHTVPRFAIMNTNDPFTNTAYHKYRKM